MTNGIVRFFIFIFFCDSFSSRKRVLRRLLIERRRDALIESGVEVRRPKHIGLKGKELAAYLFIVNAEQKPLLVFAGIPVAVLLYSLTLIQLIG